MKHEVDIFSVLVPSLLLWIDIAYGLLVLLRAVFARTGFYRVVRHRALFDVSLFVCLLGGVVYLSVEYLS
jgi:hypothetical protein